METAYVIKKIMTRPSGRKSHVFVTNGYSEVLELKHKNIATNLAGLMEENSDSGWRYEVVEIKNKTI